MANVTKKTGGGPIIEDVTETTSPSPLDNLSETQMKKLLQKLLSEATGKLTTSVAPVGDASSSNTLTATTTATAAPPPSPPEIGFGEAEIREILQRYVSVTRGEDGISQVFVGSLVFPKEFPSNIFSSAGSAGAFKDGPALVMSVVPGVHLKEENRCAALNHDPVKDATLAYSDGDQIQFCEWDSRLLKSIGRSSFSSPTSAPSASSSSGSAVVPTVVADPNAPSATLQKFIDDERNLSRCVPGSTNIRPRAGTTIANFTSEDKEAVITVKKPWTVLDAKQDTVDLVVMIYVGEVGKIMHIRTPRYKLCNSD
jgi:hypothetical protein